MQYFAFLRAVNVGKRKLSSQHFQQLLEELGLSGVGTFLASGNACFQSRRKPDGLQQEIQAAIEKQCGFVSECFLRTRDQLEHVVAANPFDLSSDQQQTWLVNVAFVQDVVTKQKRKELEKLSSDYDAVRCIDRQVYWLCRGNRMSDSPIFQTFAKSLPDPNTVRKRTTLVRLLDRFPKS